MQVDRLTKTDLKLLAVLLPAAFAVFANTLVNQFVYDDHYLIEWNHALRDWTYFTRLFVDSHSYDVPWLNINAMSLDYYRPFTRMLFVLAYQVFELQTKYWHLLNVMIFSAIVALAYILIRQMSGKRAIAIAGTLLFIVHPIHSEVVAWVNCLGELLHALFFLGAFALYLHLESIDRKPLFFLGSLTLFVAALLSKEAALCFPILVAAHKFIHTEEGLFRRATAALRAAMPFLIVVAIYIGWRFFVYGGTLRVGSKLPLVFTLLTIPSVVLEYLKMLLFPAGLSPVHSVPIVLDAAAPSFWLPLLLLVAIAALVWLRGPRMLAFACAWIIVTLLPVLNIGGFIPDLIIQDRYAFLPSLGFCAAVAMGFGRLLESGGMTARLRPVLLGLFAAAVVALLALTIRQNGFWYSDQTLFERAVAVNPGSEFAQCSYGWALYYGEKKDEAALHFTRSFQIKNGRSGCGCLGMGNYYADQKDYDQAIQFYERAIELKQGELNLLVFIKLAEAYNEKGQKGKAVDLLSRTIEANPNFGQARAMLGKLMGSTGLGDINHKETENTKRD
jgi:protein O-mannosyl-transferase